MHRMIHGHGDGDQAPDLLRLYHRIFDGTDAPARVARLRSALRSIDPFDIAGTRGPVDELLRALDPDGGVHLGDEQLLLLRRAWTSAELGAVAPGATTSSDREGAVAPQRPSERMLRFWKQLLADMTQARALQTLLGAWYQGRNDPSGPALRQALVCKLHELDPTEPWSDEQIEALVTLLVADIRFQAVSPWPMPGNVW